MRKKTVGYIVECEGNVCCVETHGDAVGVLLYGQPATIFRNRRRCDRAIRRSIVHDLRTAKKLPGYQARPFSGYRIIRLVEE